VAEPGYLSVFGHEDTKDRLVSAILSGRLGQSLLLYGPRGVGKQRLAVWTAAAINCEHESARPCGECRSCRLAAGLQHPDIHWFFPLPRPKRASGPDKLRQKLEESRADVLAERRENLLYLGEEDEGATGIYVAAVQTMRQHAYKAPAMGPSKILIIGRAESLVPQAANPEAANALLKLLEEPPADTTLILTSDVPGALLPTIRSRVQSIRVPPLSSGNIAEFISDRLDVPPAQAQKTARLSGGSIGVAIDIQSEETDGGREGALELVRALLDGRFVARLGVAHSYKSFGARGNFSRVLSEARNLLRDLLAVAAGSEASDPEAIARLKIETDLDASRLVHALEVLEDARSLADRNVNPQLVVVNLLRRASVRRGAPTVHHAGSGGRP
jgi:DNA polymerase-3 subunit delta'